MDPPLAQLKKPFLLRSLVVDEELYGNLDEIVGNCKKLLHLKIGIPKSKTNPNGALFDGRHSINDLFELHEDDSSDNESLDGEGSFELDVKLISSNLHLLESLHINSNLTLKRQPVAPPTLDELLKLKELVLNPLTERVNIDRSRDEWNLRVLGQSSVELEILDLRGCYLKIFSLGWLKTDKLKALHLFYQVPAASVIARWVKSLRFLTLAKVSKRYRTYRNLGPEKPGEELDACLEVLATNDSQLLQIDLRESDCTLNSLLTLINTCGHLSYVNTQNCEKLPENLQVVCQSPEEVSRIFRENL